MDDTERKRVQVILPQATVTKLDKIAHEYATSRSQAITIATRAFGLTERLREGEPQGEKE